MKLRKSFIPKSKQDIACSLFLFFVIPVIFYYEIETILPAVHDSSIFYISHVVLATFLLFNILGNLLSIVLIDSRSVSGFSLPRSFSHKFLIHSVYSTDELMTKTRFKSDPTAHQWILCDKCELVVPPRSWHCDTCGVCILKR